MDNPESCLLPVPDSNEEVKDEVTVHDWLQKQRPFLRFVPVFGSRWVHFTAVALNLFFAIYLLTNCILYRAELDRLIDRVFQLHDHKPTGCSLHSHRIDKFFGKIAGPLPALNSSAGARIYGQLADVVEMLEDPTDDSGPLLSLPHLLSKIMASFGVMACLVGCIDLLLARRFLCDSNVETVFLEARRRMEKENLLKDSVLQRMVGEAQRFFLVGLCSSLAMTAALAGIFCMYDMDLSYLYHFLLPWLWSVFLRRGAVYAVACSLRIATARIDLFCRELQKQRESPRLGFFTEKLEDYWALDEQLMRLCHDAMNQVLLSTLSMTLVGAYCSIMAMLLTPRPGFKFIFVLLTGGFVATLFQVLWPFAKLSDRCCSPSKLLDSPSLRTEILKCSKVKMDTEMTSEFLKLCQVIESSPVGAKLPFLGLITTADLVFFSKLALTTLPTSVAWILTRG